MKWLVSDPHWLTGAAPWAYPSGGGGVVPQPPVSITAPSLAGSVAQGSTLTITPGTWTGSPTLLYNWQRNSGTGGAWVTFLSRTTQRTYATQAADVGYQVRAVEVANNGVGGDVTRVANSIGPITAQAQTAPSLVSVARLTGAVTQGSTLSVAPGVWNGSPTPTLLYTWQRRLGTTGSWTTILAKVPDRAYVTQAADVGYFIRVVEVANNGVGGDVSQNASGILGPIEAANVAPPAEDHVQPVWGVEPSLTTTGLEPGDMMTVAPGTFTAGTPEPQVRYVWLKRVGTSGAWSTIISGVGLDSYTIQDTERGHNIMVRAEAFNGGAKVNRNARNILGPVPGTAVSENTNKPFVVAGPYITGTPEVGEDLTVNNGTWGNAPTSFSYRWLKRPSTTEGAFTTLQASADPTYRLQPGDDANYITVTVTGTNTNGSTARNTASNPPYGVVLPAQPAGVPVMAKAPVSRGVAAVGETVAIVPGVWNNSPRARFEYRWQYQDGASWVDLAPRGANRMRTFAAGDLGRVVRCIVYAINSNGEASRTLTIGTVGNVQIVPFASPSINNGLGVMPPAALYKHGIDYGTDFLSQAKIVHAESITTDMRSTYDPSDHMVHPYVLEMNPSFRGYRFICAITALPKGDDFYEDPFLYGSHDLYSWEPIPGVPHPLATPANSLSFNTDTFITHDPTTGELIVGWRQCFTTFSPKYTTDQSLIQLMVRKTKDGVTWTPAQKIYEETQSIDNCLSPAIIYDPERTIWHMWAPDRKNGLANYHYYSAPALNGPWTKQEFGTGFPTVIARLQTPHHGEVKWFGNRMVILCSERHTGEQFMGIIDPATPMNITWTPHSIITADGSQPYPTYKASVLPIREGSNWRLALFYTGIGSPEKVFKVGLSPQVFAWSNTP